MELNEKIYKLMETRNIKNVMELSRQCSIPYTTLKSIMDGQVNDIRINTAIKLCEFFNISLDDFISNDLDTSTLEIAAYQGLDIEGLDVSDLAEVNDFIKYVKSKKKNK